MTHTRCRCILVGIMAAFTLSVLSGCASVTLTAANSVNPVLLGPVRAIGGKPVPDYINEGRDKNGKFLDSYAFFYDNLSHKIQSTGSISSSTLNSGYYINSSSAMKADDPARTDIQVLKVTQGDWNRRVDILSIDCNGFFTYLVLAIVDNVECSAWGLSPGKMK